MAVEILLYTLYWVFHNTISFFSLGEKIKHAVVNIRGANGIEGKLLIEEVELFSIIQGRITGLPEGQHGFHIHQYGDLSNGCKSTGVITTHTKNLMVLLVTKRVMLVI